MVKVRNCLYDLLLHVWNYVAECLLMCISDIRVSVAADHGE